MFPKIKQFLNKKNILLCVAALLLVIAGYLTVSYLTVKYFSKAAGPVETGYGCYNYGNSAVYGSCRTKLVNADIPNLSSTFTTGGIICTPSPAEINTKVTCTGTLNDKRLAPQNVLSLGVLGQTFSECTFVVDTFTCPNIPVGSSAGSLNLDGSIAPDTGSTDRRIFNTTVKLNITNHTLVAADLVSNNLLVSTGPFSTLTCGTNNTVTASQVSTCVATIRPGFTIPSDFKFGIGVNPGGQCITTGVTLTCTNVPTTSSVGKQNLKVQIGSSALYEANLLINVSLNTATSLIRTGGAGLWLVGVIFLGVAGWVSATVVKFRKKVKRSSQDK
jgi:hypothetical protein